MKLVSCNSIFINGIILRFTRKLSRIGSTAGIGNYSAGGLGAAAGTTAAMTAYGVSALRRNSPVKSIESLMNAVKAGQNAENSSNYISRGKR